MPALQAGHPGDCISLWPRAPPAPLPHCRCRGADSLTAREAKNSFQASQLTLRGHQGLGGKHGDLDFPVFLAWIIQALGCALWGKQTCFIF